MHKNATYRSVLPSRLRVIDIGLVGLVFAEMLSTSVTVITAMPREIGGPRRGRLFACSRRRYAPKQTFEHTRELLARLLNRVWVDRSAEFPERATTLRAVAGARLPDLVGKSF